MADLKTASNVKGDSKPAATSEDKEEVTGTGDVVNTGNTDEQSISSVGEKNIADPKVGGDGSVAGDAPNTFVDKRELQEGGYDKNYDEEKKTKTL
jgi:hypothetical protein